ncbi:metal-dependent hydrolase, partial [Halorhodospira halophila]|uniref:metal-dependent hydrolase n=1 Tax=Halorhodospira halophila TaxID=1053 RepID=UPI00191326AF
GRRGVTHSLLLVAVLAALTHHLEPPSQELAVAFGIGYGLHIASDLLNPRGVALLFPLQARFRAPATVRTGGVGEAVITTLIVGTAVVSITGVTALPF